jgi:succinate-semialdehyde dehydrogenase/glutarate-semialdehyde dehydrogenase
MAIYEAIASEGPRRRYRLRSPATLEPIGELECMTPEDVAAALERARKAQPAWAALSFDERARVLDRVRTLVLDRQDRIMQKVIEETGKTETEAFGMEVFASCDALCYYAKNAKRFLAPQKKRIHGVLGFAKRLRIVYIPGMVPSSSR